jgi:hypothetical protein
VSASSEGLNISANFADDDEAAMRGGPPVASVTVSPADAAAAAQFAAKHKDALAKLSQVRNTPSA